MERFKPTIIIAAELDKLCVWSLNRYRCEGDFAIFVVEEFVSENPYRVAKGASGISVLMMSIVMMKLKWILDLKDVYDI